MAGRKTELAAYLGTQYFINLRRPRTENELRALIYQLEALSHHFDVPTKETKAKDKHNQWRAGRGRRPAQRGLEQGPGSGL